MTEVSLTVLAGFVDLYALDQIIEKMIEDPKWGWHEWFWAGLAFSITVIMILYKWQSQCKKGFETNRRQASKEFCLTIINIGVLYYKTDFSEQGIESVEKEKGDRTDNKYDKLIFGHNNYFIFMEGHSVI